MTDYAIPRPKVRRRHRRPLGPREWFALGVIFTFGFVVSRIPVVVTHYWPDVLMPLDVFCWWWWYRLATWAWRTLKAWWDE